MFTRIVLLVLTIIPQGNEITADVVTGFEQNSLRYRLGNLIRQMTPHSNLRDAFYQTWKASSMLKTVL